MADLLAGVMLVAILYVLVRPQSKGADLINAFGSAMTAIVTKAADLSSTSAQ